MENFIAEWCDNRIESKKRIEQKLSVERVYYWFASYLHQVVNETEIPNIEKYADITEAYVDMKETTPWCYHYRIKTRKELSKEEAKDIASTLKRRIARRLGGNEEYKEFMKNHDMAIVGESLYVRKYYHNVTGCRKKMS